MTSFNGGKRELDAFIKRVQRMGDADFIESLSLKLAEEALALVAMGFRAESDPYGKRWAGLKYRNGRILQDKGRLRASFLRRSVTAHGFRIGSAVTYAGAHQDPQPRANWGKRPGSMKALPRRMMVPADGRIPREWARAFAEIIQEHLAHGLKG